MTEQFGPYKKSCAVVLRSASGRGRVAATSQREALAQREENTMSDNEDKTTLLSLTMTILPSGSVRVESDRGESFTFLTDMTQDGLTYFGGTGILEVRQPEGDPPPS